MGLVFALPVIFSPSAFANTSTIYLTSASSTVQYGANFVVNVNGYVDYSPSVPYFDSGSKRVYGSVTFPSNLLQIASVSTANSPYNWNNNMATDNIAGKLAFDNQSQSGTYGKTINIMAITFQAKAAGTATINFTSNTRYDVNIPQLYAGTITIKGGPAPAPAPSPTPAPAPTPTPGTTPTTTPTPTIPGLANLSPIAMTPTTELKDSGSAEKKGFAVSDGEVARGYDQSVVGWKTNEPSRSVFKYGTSQDKLDKDVEVTLRPDEGYQVRLAGLTPGKQYFFEVEATAASDANKTDKYTGTFTTKGFPVEIIFTQGGQPAPDLKVKQGTFNYKTDKDGKLQLELPSGEQELAIETTDGDKPVKLTVVAKALSADGKAPDTQHFKFDLPAVAATEESGGVPWLTIVGVVIGLISAGGIFAFVVFWMKRRAQMGNASSYDADYGYTTTVAQTPIEPLPSYAGSQEPYPTMGEIPEPPKPYQPPSTVQESLKEEDGPDMWDSSPLPEPSTTIHAEPAMEQEMQSTNEQFDEAGTEPEDNGDMPEQINDQPEENAEESYENESPDQEEYSEALEEMSSDDNMDNEDYDQASNEEELPEDDPTEIDIQQDEQVDDEMSEEEMTDEDPGEPEDSEDEEDGMRIDHSK